MESLVVEQTGEHIGMFPAGFFQTALDCSEAFDEYFLKQGRNGFKKEEK